MQISPVSLASFEGKKKAQKQVVITPEEFAEFDDRQLGVLANVIASEKVNDKKHRKINRAMYYNLPLAGGLAVLVSSAKATRIGKLGAFAAGTAAWGAGILAADALFGAKHAVENRSSKLREFNKNHPVISTVGALGGILAIMLAGGKGVIKLADKVLPKLAETKLYSTVAPKVVRMGTKLAANLDKSVVLNKLSSALTRVPSSIKSFAKTMALNAPLMLVIGQLGHAFNHRAAKTKVAMDTFSDLKNAQEAVRENLMNDELADRLAAEQV